MADMKKCCGTCEWFKVSKCLSFQRCSLKDDENSVVWANEDDDACEDWELKEN